MLVYQDFPFWCLAKKKDFPFWLAYFGLCIWGLGWSGPILTTHTTGLMKSNNLHHIHKLFQSFGVQTDLLSKAHPQWALQKPIRYQWWSSSPGLTPNQYVYNGIFKPILNEFDESPLNIDEGPAVRDLPQPPWEREREAKLR